MQIQDNVFVVTGGGSGLGAATVRALAAGGAKVVIVDRDADAGQAVAKESGGAFVRADVTDEGSVQKMYEFAARLGGLRGVINCAGVAPAEKVIGKSGVHAMASFSRTLQINVAGTFNVLRFAAEIMAGQEVFGDGERGVIINTASIAAFDGQVGQTAYAASKGAIVAMTLPLVDGDVNPHKSGGVRCRRRREIRHRSASGYQGNDGESVDAGRVVGSP
ncbi:SDR family NAD(P)-dependent oxidoreductase [Cupriavidus necator]